MRCGRRCAGKCGLIAIRAWVGFISSPGPDYLARSGAGLQIQLVEPATRPKSTLSSACGLDMGAGEPLFLYRWYPPIQVENLLRSLSLRVEDYTLDIYGNLFIRIAYQMCLA